LLAIAAEHGAALHYDSLNGCNEQEARKTTAKLAHLLKQRTPIPDPNSQLGLLFHSMLCPQQDNSSDCGVYVLLATNVLVQRLLALDHTTQPKNNPWSLDNVSFNADTGRLQMQRLIAQMIETRGRKIGNKADIEISPSPDMHAKV
jgi:Ulp1 family protease